MRLSLSLSGSRSLSSSQCADAGAGFLPASRVRISETSEACAVRRREWRSSSLGAGWMRNGKTAPSGSIRLDRIAVLRVPLGGGSVQPREIAGLPQSNGELTVQVHGDIAPGPETD